MIKQKNQKQVAQCQKTGPFCLPFSFVRIVHAGFETEYSCFPDPAITLEKLTLILTPS